jgi:PAS domain S-box-containing protein
MHQTFQRFTDMDKIRILMVEDLPSDAELIKYEIKKSGIRFDELVVDTEGEYRKAILNFKPDIILSDYSMPRFNGLQALYIREEMSPLTPFVLVTGSMNEETAVEIMKAGADDYIIKEHLTRLGMVIRTSIEKKETIRQKKKAEERIKVLSQAVEQNPASIILMDINGNIQYANHKFTQITGYQPEEVLGKKVQFVKGGITTEDEIKKIWETVTAGGEWSGELPSRRRNGEVYYESVTVSPIMNEQGEITNYLGINMDITQKKEMEEKLAWEQYLLQTLLENIPDYIYFKDRESKFLRINKALAQAFGLENPLLALGKSDRDFFSSEHARQAYDDEQQIMKSGKPLIAVEEKETWPNRPATWAFSTKMPLRDAKGNLIGTFGISRDITGLKKGEEAIRTLSKAIEQSPTSIIITDADGKIEFVNQRFVTFTQYSAEESKGIIPRMFNPEYNPKELYEGIWKTIKAGKTWEGEYKNFKKDGTEFWEYVVVTPLLDNNGAITNFILTKEDITEKKKILNDLIRAKEKAEESDRLKTAFLQNISHEIRTPLNSIVGFSSVLGRTDLSPEKREEYQNIINVSNEQLLSIITGIISISSLETGQEEVVIKETNVNQLLENIYNQFSLSRVPSGVSFTCHYALPSEMAYIYTDPVKLMQIMVNLVGNALKFTSKGHVKFGYVIVEKFLRFYVEDSGIGIPEDMHDVVFERFRQLDNSSIRKYGGAGLGLALSKGYAELLGGSVELTSEPDKGATFVVVLPYKPVVKIKTPEKEFRSQEQLLPAGKTILVAEDESNNFIMIRELLTSLKLKVVKAVNGLEAVDYCKANNPDLVLMDIKMPVMDGIQATLKIKEFKPSLPIIALTAYTFEEEKKNILASGCDAYLEKPVHQNVLNDVLLKFLKK